MWHLRYLPAVSRSLRELTLARILDPAGIQSKSAATAPLLLQVVGSRQSLPCSPNPPWEELAGDGPTIWCAMKAVIHTADHALHTGVGHTHHYCDVCITQWYNYLDHLHKARFWNEWEFPGYVLADGIGEEAANEGAVNSENGVQVHHMPRVPPKTYLYYHLLPQLLITYFHCSYVIS